MKSYAHLGLTFCAILILVGLHQKANAIDNAMGVHGMVLIKTRGGLVASHMPLHDSMHAHQVILQLALDETHQAELEAKLDNLFTDEKMITLMPEPFDLHLLLAGKIKDFSGDLYHGHFERYGKIAIANLKFQVKKILLAKRIDEVKNGTYYQVKLENNQALLIHRIGELPSFDQIFLIETKASAGQILESLTDGSIIQPNEAAFYLQSKGVRMIELLYLETGDFKAL